jgi:hypothetical protein
MANPCFFEILDLVRLRICSASAFWNYKQLAELQLPLLRVEPSRKHLIGRSLEKSGVMWLIYFQCRCRPQGLLNTFAHKQVTRSRKVRLSCLCFAKPVNLHPVVFCLIFITSCFSSFYSLVWTRNWCPIILIKHITSPVIRNIINCFL